jgi:hypothetical protein
VSAAMATAMLDGDEIGAGKSVKKMPVLIGNKFLVSVRPVSCALATHCCTHGRQRRVSGSRLLTAHCYMPFHPGTWVAVVSHDPEQAVNLRLLQNFAPLA